MLAGFSKEMKRDFLINWVICRNNTAVYWRKLNQCSVFIGKTCLLSLFLYWHHQFQCLWIFWISSSEIHMNEFSNYHPTKFNCHLLFVEQITYCLLTKAIKVKKQYEILPCQSSHPSCVILSHDISEQI